MRVLIVSEGVSELGQPDRAVALDGKAKHAGALQVLVARLREEQREKLEFKSIDVRHRDLGTVHAKGEGGMFKKAIACLRYAERHGFEAMVMVIDQDREKYKYRRAELSKAQDSDKHVGVRRALAVAVLTFDAWMLADEVALSKAIGKVVPTQPDPESIDDAKDHCRSLREEHGCEAGMSDFYASVAKHARLEVWEERCADGFGVFAERVRQM